jgi:hypothetical protein
VGGACEVKTCASGYADCNGANGDGCEVETANDPVNCGACTHACSLAHVATNGCSGGACTILACAPGYQDCNGTASDGCEVDTDTSVANCGSCGVACTVEAHVATERCVGGACGVATCATGYGDCNGTSADGCETDLLTSLADCGACGAPCAGLCESGSCCIPASMASTCAGLCGSVANNCGQMVACGGCTALNVCGNGGPNLCGPPVGTALWSLAAGGSGSQILGAIAVDPSGDVLVAGDFGNRGGTLSLGTGPTFTSAAFYSMYVGKLDPNGNELWSKSFGNTNQCNFYSVAADATNNVFVLGTFEGTLNFGGSNLSAPVLPNIVLVKFDPNGNHVWSERFGDTTLQNATSVAVDGAGSAIITGDWGGTFSFGGPMRTGLGGGDLYLAKYDANGAWQWDFEAGTANQAEIGIRVATDASNNILVAGEYTASFNLGGCATLPGPGYSGPFLAKFSSAGACTWSAGFANAAGTAWGSDLAVDAAGESYLVGQFDKSINLGGGALASAGDPDAFVAKFSASGATLWSKRYGGAGTDAAWSVSVDAATGNVFVVGAFTGSVDFGGGPVQSYNAGAGTSMFLLKLSSAGAFIDVTAYPWTSQGSTTGWSPSGGGPMVRATSTSDAILGGGFGGTIDFGTNPALTTSGTADLFLAKVLP